MSIPVILHTDIGEDIDDTWALIMMLKQRELNPLMILTDTGDTAYRAALCAKLLQRAGREDIPIGLGLNRGSAGYHDHQKDWVKDFAPCHYRGGWYDDGIEKMIELIMNSPVPVTLISIGPATSIAEALRREPRIAAQTTLVGMFGSIGRKHYGEPGCIQEYNVLQDVPACQQLFAAPWRRRVITPLDSCGVVVLDGALYNSIETSGDPLLRDLMDNYRIWCRAQQREMGSRSSILFDTVAIHLAQSEKFLTMEEMPLRVTDDGYTVRDDVKGVPFRVATGWYDLPGYLRFLVETLLTP